MKIELQGHIHFKKDEYSSTEYHFWGWEDMKDQGYVYVCPYTIEFELPEGFDPRNEQIAILEAKRREVQAQFEATITRINSEISKLQAITYEAPEVV